MATVDYFRALTDLWKDIHTMATVHSEQLAELRAATDKMKDTVTRAVQGITTLQDQIKEMHKAGTLTDAEVTMLTSSIADIHSGADSLTGAMGGMASVTGSMGSTSSSVSGAMGSMSGTHPSVSGAASMP